MTVSAAHEGAARVRVDTDRCVFTMQCTYHAPDVFDIDDDGEMTYRGEITATERDAVALAAELCPSRAITVTTAPDGDDENEEQSR